MWEDFIKHKAYREWTRMDFATSARAAEDRTGWKRIVAQSSMVSYRTCIMKFCLVAQHLRRF